MNSLSYNRFAITAVSLVALFTNPVRAAEKPVKVYILAGQSNMLEMGDVNGGTTRHSGFFQSAAPDAEKGVAVSVYEGAYDFWECGRDIDVVVVGARPISAPTAYLVLVQVQMVSDFDWEALERIMDTFDVFESSLP